MRSGFVTDSLETCEILRIEFTRRVWMASNNDLPQLHDKIDNGNRLFNYLAVRGLPIPFPKIQMTNDLHCFKLTECTC